MSVSVISSRRAHPTTRGVLAISALLLALFWGADALIYHDLWTSMYPTGDEFSLITHSARISADWFLSGYSRYFIVYPEWTHSPHFNFARPVANLIYWAFGPLSQLGFKLQLLIVNYGAHCLIAAAMFFTCAALLRNSLAVSAAIAVTSYLAPPFFDSPTPVLPCYALDGVAALFCLLAVVLISRRRDLPALLCLLLALLTKEAATAVVGAVLVFGLLHRRSSLTAGCLALTAAWIAVRLIAFGRLGGTYSSDSLGSLAAIIIRLTTITHLPLGHVNDVQLKAVAGGRIFSESVLFLVLNLAIALLFARLLLRVRPWRRIPVRSEVAGDGDDARTSSLSQLSLLAAAFSVAFFVLIAGAGEVRYAYVFFVMFLLFLASLPESSRRAWLLGLLLLGAAGGAVSAIAHQQAAGRLLIARYDASRGLVAALKALSPDAQPVFVVNDFVGEYSAERNVAAFAGYPGELVRLDSIDPGSCTAAELRLISTQIRTAGGDEVMIDLPPCASFVFEGVDGSPPIRGDALYRNPAIQYVFPHLLRSKSKWSGRPIVQLGDTVRITLRAPGRLLYFDFPHDRWAVLQGSH